jgi:hypothetical protein
MSRYEDGTGTSDCFVGIAVFVLLTIVVVGGEDITLLLIVL